MFSEGSHRCPEEPTRDDRPELDTYYESPSGHFWIHYDITEKDDNSDGIIDNGVPDLSSSDGDNISDYVQSAAIAADSARYILTQKNGIFR